MSEPANTVIEITDLHKSFGSNAILKGMDLTIRKGENVVILGKSGSGKSVLIKCIIGLIYADEGNIKVLDKNILELNNEELNEVRLKMGFLFQNAALYDSMTVRENLDFHLKRTFKDLSEEDREQAILKALDDVGLKEAVDKMPSELSGGMRKRVGLARCLIINPEIMLYDEPTTGLDTVTSREISELILEMQKKNKTTSVIITHDMACAKMTSDRVVVFKDGVITAEGSYEELEKSKDAWVKSFFN